jgi:hypothetical protein
MAKAGRQAWQASGITIAEKQTLGRQSVLVRTTKHLPLWDVIHPQRFFVFKVIGWAGRTSGEIISVAFDNPELLRLKLAILNLCVGGTSCTTLLAAVASTESEGTSKLDSLLPEERLCGLSQAGNCAPFRFEVVKVPTFDFNKLWEDALGETILRAKVAGLADETAELVEAEGLLLFAPARDEVDRPVAEPLKVGFCVDLFSEARGEGDGDGSWFGDAAKDFRAAGDGTAGQLAPFTAAVRGKLPIVARAEGDAARGADFTDGDAGLADDFTEGDADPGATFTEGDAGRGDNFTGVTEGLGKDLTVVRGNGTMTPDALGFSKLGAARGEEEGDGRGDTFKEVRAGLTEDFTDVGGNGTMTLEDLGFSTLVPARGDEETLLTALSAGPDLGLAGDEPRTAFPLAGPFWDTEPVALAGLTNGDAGRDAVVAVKDVFGFLDGDAVLGGAVTVVDTEVFVCLAGDAVRGGAFSLVAAEEALACLAGDAVRGGAVTGPAADEVLACLAGAEAVRGGAVTLVTADEVLVCLAGDAVRGGGVTLVAGGAVLGVAVPLVEADEVLVCLAGDAVRGGAAADEVLICLIGDAGRGRAILVVAAAEVLRGLSAVLGVINGRVTLVSDTLDVEVGVPGSLISDTLDAEVGVPGSLMTWSTASSTFISPNDAINCSRHCKMHNSNQVNPHPLNGQTQIRWMTQGMSFV